jgi:hypothetical protein
MQTKAYVVLIILLAFSIVSNLNLASSSTSVRVNWALLVSGTNYLYPFQTREPLRDCYYMFHLLTSHWGVPRDHIKFLDINPTDAQYSWVPWGTIDGNCSYSSVKAAIDWLKAHSTSNDNVLIFIASHGGGYDPGMSLEQSGGRIDVSGDEGSETWGGSEWYGVDECIMFDDAGDSSKRWWYWDDDLKSDLAGIAYNQMVIVFMSCFSGGFIDDLSAPNRIIITSSKETTTTTSSSDIAAGFTPFIGHFLDAFNGDALHRYHAVWNTGDVNNRIVDQCEITVPDKDCDGVDWRNAYAYARDQFPGDSPWFDSNGNKLPTYKNGQDYIEYFLYVWHTWGGYTTPDTGGYEYPAGTTVNVYATPCIAGYYFAYWLPDDIPWWVLRLQYPTWNPYTYTMDKDHAIGAYFYPEGGGGGGGDGCPTLFAWNGTCYVDYGIINIHNPTGEDVIREVSVKAEDVSINSYKAKFRLREGWPGLNFSESVIDQVKLYAIDNNGNHYLCPLISAKHSRLGNVLPQLLFSDEWKVQTLLLETVDLTFIVPCQNIQSFTFTIEGCNRFKQ